jgi:cyanophycinase
MGFRIRILAGLAAAALAAGAAAQTPLPSHGPSKGYLVITGGIPDYTRMIGRAGGKAAHIVVIPTAALENPAQEKLLPPYCSTIFAGMKCTILHTTDRKIADSSEFVAPLKDATGVYLEGGRQWRLADAYLGTLTLKEIFAVLDRGGVVMGGSAGATIQGSYLVRGSSNPDDPTIMMSPGHEAGFSLITNTAIDQHVDARGRQNDLASVMKAHPGLLGIGLDQRTSITVHGDTLTCNGPRRAAIWDGKDHDGKGYYYLRAGDTLNLVTRVATLVPHAPDPWDNPARLAPAQLASDPGAYQFKRDGYMLILAEDGQLVTQLGQGPKVPIFADPQGKFVTQIDDSYFVFVEDSTGKVTALEWHQGGRVIVMNRLDDAAAKAAIAAKRYQAQLAAPGSEASLRLAIAGVLAGTPPYDQMTPKMANGMRQWLPQVGPMLTTLGAVKSVTFKGVDQNGSDMYQVEFEKATTGWQITLAPDGKIDSLNLSSMH